MKHNFFLKLPNVLIALAITLSLGMEYVRPAQAGATQFLGSVQSFPVTMGKPVVPNEFRGDLRKLPQTVPLGKQELHPLMPAPYAQKKPISNSIPPSIQIHMPALSMPTTSSSFDGMTRASNGSGWPPDTNGDVGPTYYIQAVNTSVGIFNKTTGALVSAFTVDSFWNGIGTTACNGFNKGDPTVLYDPLADRWIFADFAWQTTAGPYYECFAASKTGDPLSGGWRVYAVVTDNTLLADYPKMGLWPDGIYMSANMYNSIPAYQGARAWAFNRSDMENGASLRFASANLTTAYFGLLPSNLRGNLPPVGTPNFFVSNDQAGFYLDVWKFHLDWTTPANNTFTGPSQVSIANYTAPPASIPQLGGGAVDALDSIGDRLMMQNQYRYNGTESLWLTHTVGSGGVAGIRWYQLNVTGGTVATSPVQSSTFQPDSNYRWVPSLAVDHLGNMAIGYSVSSSSMYPDIRYAGRLVSDPLNSLGQGEATLIAGGGAQNGGFGRWGDYSAMSVDPTDDCTFWYTSEYYSATGNNWQTRIGSFKFPSCLPLSVKLFLPLIMR